METNFVKKIFISNIGDLSYNYKLNKPEISFINHLINQSPETLKKISDIVNQNTVDYELALHEIPSIVFSIGEIYKALLEDTRDQNVEIDRLLEFTLNSLFDSSKFVTMPQNEFVKINDIIHTCVKLVKLGKPVKEKSDECNLWDLLFWRKIEPL